MTNSRAGKEDAAVIIELKSERGEQLMDNKSYLPTASFLLILIK